MIYIYIIINRIIYYDIIYNQISNIYIINYTRNKKKKKKKKKKKIKIILIIEKN